MINQWKPISEAKKLKKGFMRIYSFRPENSGRMVLSRHFDFYSHFGYRTCDLYMDIVKPTEEVI